jgi:hypothetical protein
LHLLAQKKINQTRRLVIAILAQLGEAIRFTKRMFLQFRIQMASFLAMTYGLLIIFKFLFCLDYAV